MLTSRIPVEGSSRGGLHNTLNCAMLKDRDFEEFFKKIGTVRTLANSESWGGDREFDDDDDDDDYDDGGEQCELGWR